MNYFILPKMINNIDYILVKRDSSVRRLNNHQDKDNSTIFLSKTLNKYLTEIKHQINDYINDWDLYKKYTNPYEYIHSIVPKTAHSVAKYKPLSRSFYKMIEICHLFELQNLLNKDFKSFHLAEGPGGFIEALIFLKLQQPLQPHISTIHYGMTLQSTNIDVPSWKRSQDFLKKNPNVIIENGPTNTGDLFKLQNLKYCYENHHNTMTMITGDGGFDFSVDYDNQEHASIQLIFSQICFALSMQCIGGIFILKIFDIFTRPTVELLYILVNFYETVYLVKPYTSRLANSEKYIVCSGFKGISLDFINNIFDIYEEAMRVPIDNNNSIIGFLDIEMPYLFINKIEEYNAIFGQQQMENINNTINKIINKDMFNDDCIKTNIQKCILWCQKYDIPYYEEHSVL